MTIQENPYDKEINNKVYCVYSGPCYLRGLHFYNPNVKPCFLHVFDSSLCNVDIHSSIPKRVYILKANEERDQDNLQVQFGSGICFAVSIHERIILFPPESIQGKTLYSL